VRLFDQRTIAVALLQGLLAFALVSLALGVAVRNGYDPERSRAFAFSTLVTINLALILANRSSSRSILTMLRTPNTALWWIVGGALTVLLLSLTVGPLRGIFRFGVPSPHDIGAAFAIGGVALLGSEALKRLGNHFDGRLHHA
jgi:P-type Ca2+ transporter type 2C